MFAIAPHVLAWPGLPHLLDAALILLLPLLALRLLWSHPGPVTLIAAPGQSLRLRRPILLGRMTYTKRIPLADFAAIACLCTPFSHGQHGVSTTFRLDYALVPRVPGLRPRYLLRTCPVILPTPLLNFGAPHPSPQSDAFEQAAYAFLPPHLDNITALAHATGLANGGFIGCAEDVYYHCHRTPGKRDVYGLFPRGEAEARHAAARPRG